MTPEGKIIPEAKSRLSEDRRRQLTKLLNETIESGKSLDCTKEKLEHFYEMKELERMLKARLVHRAKKVYSEPKGSSSRRTRKEEFSREDQVKKWISGQAVQEQQIVDPSYPSGDDDSDNGKTGRGRKKKNDEKRGGRRKSGDTNDASFSTKNTGLRSKSNKCQSQSITNSLDMKKRGKIGERVREGDEGVRRNVSNNSRPPSSYGLRKNSIPCLSGEEEEIEKLVLDDVISLEGDSWKDSSTTSGTGNRKNPNTCPGNHNNDGMTIERSENRNGSINLTLFGSEHERHGYGGRRRSGLMREVFTPTYSFAPTPIIPFPKKMSPSSLIVSKIQTERKSITAQLTLRFNGITSTSSDDFRSIKVFQEIDRGSHSFLVFSGTKINVGQEFSFSVVRKMKKPFSLSVFVDDVRDLRISTCCEYKHVPGVRLGHFTIVNVTGGGMQCDYCTGSISWKQFWRNRRKKLQEPLPSPLKGTPSPMNTIQNDDRRASTASSSSILTEVDYQEELEEYNKEAFEEDDSAGGEAERGEEIVNGHGERNSSEGERNSNEGQSSSAQERRKEEKKINEMETEKRPKRVKESLRNRGSIIKGEREKGGGRSIEEEHFQVEEEEIEEEFLPPSSSSKGTEEIVEEEEAEISVVDEDTLEGGTKSSYSGQEVMVDDLEKGEIKKKGEEDGMRKKEEVREEGATSNDTSFTSEVETLEIL